MDYRIKLCTYRATYVQSPWKSGNETKGREKTLLPNPVAWATAGICMAPYSINIQKPLLHFPESEETVKASCYIQLHYLSSPLHSVACLVGCW